MAELKHITVTGSPTDGSVVTGSNTNLTGVSIGTSNAFTIESADSFGKRRLKAVQGAANQLTSYLDLGTPTAKLGGIIPLNYTWAGTPLTTTIGRWFAGAIGVGNLGSLLVTNTNRLQFTEGAGSGTALNQTSPSGTPMVPGTDYIAPYLIDTAANTFTMSVYPVGSTTELFTIAGTLGGAMADAAGIQSVRHGINTSSATGLTLWTSEGFTLFDDAPARYDIVAPPTLASSRPAENLVDLRTSTGTGTLTFPTPVKVSGPTLTVTSLAGGLWLFTRDATTDAVYTVKVQQADGQQNSANVTIAHLPTTNRNAPLIPSGAPPGTTWR